MPLPPRPQRSADVTAVLVVHDGAAWLPEALAALAAQTTRPRRVVAVDTGSTDAGPELLAAATGPVVDRVLVLPRRSGLGAAVAAGLAAVGAGAAAAGPSRWVWLLHDDCAPAADALERLLEHAARSPSAALLGPKAQDWHDPRVLVEVGLTTDRAGHRETGLERREYDQGQHDAVRDVLAVGTAGALVRRDVWDAVGGLDPALPVFRDDLDLGWRVNAAGHGVVVVPAATVRHVRAATTGRRPLDAASGRPEAIDRRHALLVLLAHAPVGRLVLLVPTLLLATVLRVLGFLLTRRLRAARDEVGAAASVLLHPVRLAAARRARARSRALPARALRPLLASRRGRARVRAEAVGDWLSGAAGTSPDRLGAFGDGAGEAGEAQPGPRAPRRLVLRPPVLLVLVLTVLALVAERRVLSTGGGVLTGGRLLPSPAGASDLWQAYAASWHPVSVGSAAPADPALPVLAALATVLLGKAWLAVDLVLLGSVPLAAATAYAATRRVVGHRVLRLWAAATWALLPVATGAVAAGRLDAAVAQVLLPPLLVAGTRLLVDDPRRVGLRHGWAVGLGSAGLLAFAPTLLVPVAVLLVGGAVAGLLVGGDRRAAARRLVPAVIAAIVPVLLLLPWSLQLLQEPGLLLYGPGRAVVDVAAAGPVLPAWHLPLLSPGGPGTPEVWLTVGLLCAALAGSVRAGRRRLAVGGWLIALTGLAWALVLARVTPVLPGTGQSASVWPGTALQLAAGGLLLAALLAGEGARSRLAGADFGWRQLTAGVLVVVAGAVPVLTLGSWLVRGADDPLRRDLVPVLPAFAVAELRDEPGLRVLLLDPGADRTRYAVSSGAGTVLGNDTTPPTTAQRALLDDVVADLLSPSGSDAADALATRAVRYVALPSAGAGDLPLVLDAQPGLVRRSGGDVLLWQVVSPAARLVLLPPATARAALTGARAPQSDLLRSDPPQPLPDTRQDLPAGAPGRLLVLAEAADPGWTATVDGRELSRRTGWGWATAWEVPADGGVLLVSRDQSGRRRWLALQGGLLLAVAVLAGPGARRRRGLEPEDDVPVPATAVRRVQA